MTRCVFCDSYSVYEDKCDLDLTMVTVCWEFQEVQIRKWMPLPCPVLCLYLCGDPWLICSSLSLLPILSQPLHSVLLHTGMVLNRFFLCYLCLSPHPMMHYDSPHPGLPRPVLLCPQSVSLSLTASLFPSPLSFSLLRHSSDLFLLCWSRSSRGRGERRTGLAGWHAWTIPSCFLFFFSLLSPFLLLLSIVEAYDTRWQSLGSNSEVGTFDRCVTHGLVTDRCSTGGAVRCGRLRLHM